MDLTYTPAQKTFRAQVREWLKNNVPRNDCRAMTLERVSEQHRQWEAKLASAGYSAVTWPKDLGGSGCDLTEWLIFEEEYWATDAPSRVNQNGILLLGSHADGIRSTPEQKARFLPRMARCDDMWAQGGRAQRRLGHGCHQQPRHNAWVTNSS